MRAVDEVVNIILTLFPDWQAYSDAIPTEVIDDRYVTQALVTESQSNVSGYGDNTFNTIDQGVDIQIFYSLDFSKNMLATEISLMKTFESAGWRITDDQAHYLDLSQTDSQQTIKNISINRTISLDEVQ